VLFQSPRTSRGSCDARRCSACSRPGMRRSFNPLGPHGGPATPRCASPTPGTATARRFNPLGPHGGPATGGEGGGLGGDDRRVSIPSDLTGVLRPPSALICADRSTPCWFQSPRTSRGSCDPAAGPDQIAYLGDNVVSIPSDLTGVLRRLKPGDRHRWWFGWPVVSIPSDLTGVLRPWPSTTRMPAGTWRPESETPRRPRRE
jgi:hypothetical protein